MSTSSSPRVALVETSELLPGLLPFQSWDVLGTADRVWLRDPAAHPSAQHLHLAGLDLEPVEPARLERTDLDLSRPGDPAQRRVAKALLQRALDGEDVVYLLGPDDEGLAPALAGMAAQHDLEIELVFLAQQPEGTELLRLIEVMRRLRDPETGCPWDLEQDHTTLLRHLVEETFELVDAIERGDDGDIAEELGDVLLQVVFHARVAADRRAFGIDDVARGIAGKLVDRHPHVFADGDAATAAEVQANWDRLKAAEKSRDGPFDGVPAAGPGLDLLHTLQREAAKLGYDPAGAEVLVAAVGDAAASVLEAGDGDARERAVGDLLERAVALGRRAGVEPEAAARRRARGFRARFEATLALAAERELDPRALDATAWDGLWQAATVAESDPAGSSGPR